MGECVSVPSPFLRVLRACGDFVVPFLLLLPIESSDLLYLLRCEECEESECGVLAAFCVLLLHRYM